MERFDYQNVMQVPPRFDKVVINIGVGEAVADPKALEAAVRDLETISGQKPIITHAKKINRGIQTPRRHGYWLQSYTARPENV